MEVKTVVSKKQVVEALRDLTAAVTAVRHQTVGGVLPECHREVKSEYVDWMEEAIWNAQDLLNNFPEKQS